MQESAELFGELGDWGGLGWAFGLLAFVRYMQGRLDEAAELAEQIAVEGLETGNRWAVGMMDVLLADVALWRGRTREAVHEGRNAMKLFQDIDDGWGEIQASAPVVRALAELGEREESETASSACGRWPPRSCRKGCSTSPTSCRRTSSCSTAIPTRRPRC